MLTTENAEGAEENQEFHSKNQEACNQQNTPVLEERSDRSIASDLQSCQSRSGLVWVYSASSTSSVVSAFEEQFLLSTARRNAP